LTMLGLNRTMRAALRRMMDAMIMTIVVYEGFARELAEMAAQATAHNPGIAEAAMVQSRQHRVKAIEMRAQLAAFSEQYTDILDEGD
jgi:hypothetical protein